MALEACCFRNGNCANLEADECVNFGGLPRGLETYCWGTPGTAGWTAIACADEACCVTFAPDDIQCNNARHSECIAMGGEPMGWGTRCWPDFDCADEYDNTRCCFADGSQATNLSENQCRVSGGVPVMLDEECPDVTPDEQCRHAGPDRLPAGARRWHRDVCQNAILTPTRRHETQAPDFGDPGYRFYREGYFELVTRRPVRAMALPQDDPGEPCRHQFAPVALEPDGYAVGLLCGDREIGGLSRSSTIPMVAASEDEFGPAGYGRLVGAYQAPFWTEAIFDSPLLICGGAPG